MTEQRRSKGTGSIRRRGERYQAIYSFTDGVGVRRRRSKFFKTKTEARKWLNTGLSEVGQGRVADARSLTVGEYLRDWLGSLGMQQLEAATVSWYRSAVERHIIPALGAVRLSRLSAVQIEGFLAEASRTGRLNKQEVGLLDKKPAGLGPASVRQVTLHKALDAAVRKGLLTVNPADLADKPKLPPRDVTETVWAPETMTAFLTATVEDRLHPAWHVACWTGLRRSELTGLKWGDIDLEAGSLSVRRARTQVDGKPIVKSPKTASSRRVVDLDAETVAVLKVWRKAQLAERLRAGAAWDLGEWVFTDQIGAPWRPDRLTRAFTSRVKALRLPGTDIKGLRHAHATVLLKAGTHPKIVQERLGHSSISVTLDIYSSVLPGMQREAVEKLAALMGER